MKLSLVIAAAVALLATIIATPALAVETPQIMPWGTVIMPPAVVKACAKRPLVQGSGSVRICAAGQL